MSSSLLVPIEDSPPELGRSLSGQTVVGEFEDTGLGPAPVISTADLVGADNYDDAAAGEFWMGVLGAEGSSA